MSWWERLWRRLAIWCVPGYALEWDKYGEFAIWSFQFFGSYEERG